MNTNIIWRRIKIELKVLRKRFLWLAYACFKTFGKEINNMRKVPAPHLQYFNCTWKSLTSSCMMFWGFKRQKAIWKLEITTQRLFLSARWWLKQRRSQSKLRLKENLLRFLLTWVTSCIELQQRKRILETFHMAHVQLSNTTYLRVPQRRNN